MGSPAWRSYTAIMALFPASISASNCETPFLVDRFGFEAPEGFGNPVLVVGLNGPDPHRSAVLQSPRFRRISLGLSCRPSLRSSQCPAALYLRPAADYSSSTFTGSTLQIRSQYSRMERSEENFPDRPCSGSTSGSTAGGPRNASPTRS